MMANYYCKNIFIDIHHSWPRQGMGIDWYGYRPRISGGVKLFLGQWLALGRSCCHVPSVEFCCSVALLISLLAATCKSLLFSTKVAAWLPLFYLVATANQLNLYKPSVHGSVSALETLVSSLLQCTYNAQLG